MDDFALQDVSTLSIGCALLLVAPDRPSGSERLLDALGTADGSTAVLVVTTADPTAAVDSLRRRGIAPDAIGVVDASGANAAPSGVAESATVAGPGSLSELGIAVSDRLDRLSHRFDRVVVGLDSVTDLVATSSVPATFRFLHVLRGRVRGEDAVLLVTIDRTAHDDETERTIAELFDETVVSPAGESSDG